MAAQDRPANPARATVIIPAHNEEAAVVDTVRSLLHADMGAVIVVDDGSDDNTAAVAAAAGARVIRSASRQGKGAALTLGAASAAGADIIAFVDADVGSSAPAVRGLIEAVAGGEAELAIGVLPPGQSGGFSVVQTVTRYGIRLLTGHTMAAPLSGQRALRAEDAAALVPFDRGFGVEAGMTVRALRRGMRVREFDVDMTHRRTGRSIAGFIHRSRQLSDVLSALFRAVAGDRP